MAENSISYASAMLLGLIQGVTEFLPISSSGHLALAQHLNLAGEDLAPITFDLLLHLATTLVVLKSFWGDIRRAVLYDRRLVFYLVIGSIPAGICGVFFNSYFRTLRENPILICFALLVTAAFLFICDRVKNGEKKGNSVGWSGALTIGLTQALALAPGISRSGLTITGGVMVGLSRREAISFSFLLMLPAVWGAMFFEIVTHGNELTNIAVGPAITGFASALISGYFALRALTYLTVKGKLHLFSIYCALAGSAGLLYFWLN